MRSLKEHRQAVLAPEIAGHRGRIVNTAGDGLLAEFANVIDAADCASVIQARIAERNADVEAGRRLEFRIGIKLGDVIIDGDDILGDGVNVAARQVVRNFPRSAAHPFARYLARRRSGPRGIVGGNGVRPAAASPT